MGRPRRVEAGEKLEPEQRDELLTGHEWIAGEAFGGGDARRRAWERHRDELLRWWTEAPGWQEIEVPETWWAMEPRGPGHRPQAWWDYEATDCRRLTDPEGLRAYIANWDLSDEEAEERFLQTVRAVESWSGPSWRGIPSYSPRRKSYYVALDPDWPKDTYLPADDRWYESEREFLERRALLYKWEAGV